MTHSNPRPGDALLIDLLKRGLLQRVEGARTRLEADLLIALYELIRMGLVIDSGGRRRTPDGHLQIVLVAAEGGDLSASESGRGASYKAP